MKIHATCLKCQATIAVAVENAGKRARCPRCGGVIVIPDATPGKAPPKSGVPSDSPRSNQPERPPEKARPVAKGTQEQPRQKGKAVPKGRRKEHSDEDLWAQPLSSYSSPAIEEHEYEAYGIAPRGQHSRGEFNPYRAQRDAAKSDPPGMKIPLIMAAIGMGCALLFGAIGFAFPPAAFVGAGIGGLIGFVLTMWGSVKILMNAFEVDPLTGFLYLFCGPYAIYFLFSRWDINQNPFLINLMGVAVWFTAIAVNLIATHAN